MEGADYEALRAQFLARLARPLDALAQLAEVRTTLDRLERALVEEARRNWSTWDEIGIALGISRQAAHRRHHHFVNRTGRP